MDTSNPAREVDAAELQRRKTFNRNKWIFSTSGIGRDMLYQLIATFLLTYIQFGVSLTLAQFTTLSLIIGVGGQIWDALNDPLMGAIIEGTHMKAGKFRPWILMGALFGGLVVILMFNIQSIPGWKFVVFMSIMYLLWESAFTMNDIGYWAMLPSLSSVKEERNSVTTLTVLFAGVGAIIAQGVIPMITTGDMRAGYRLVSIIVVTAFVGCQLMAFFGVKETPRRRKEVNERISLKKMWFTIVRNDQILWMTLSMFLYSIASCLLIALAANLLYMEIGYNGTWYFYVVVAYGVTSVVVNVLYPMLVNKLGRRRLQNISVWIAIAGYALIALMGWTSILPFNIWLMCGLAGLVSGGQSMFYMASIVNMTNCVEYNDYKHGERNEAVVSTLRPFMVKLAAATHTLLVTLVLAVSGTFLLSQSISTLETQRDYFAKEDAAAQVYYVETLQDYIGRYGDEEMGSEEYEATAAEVSALIDADEVMNKYQINSQYVTALSDAMVMRQAVNGAGASVGEIEEIGRLGEIDVSLLNLDGYTYTLEVGDLKSGEESAANLNFRDKRTTTNRVWVRMAATVAPIILLFFALLVQNRRFIIDEKYYDMMLEAIAKRDAAEKE